MEFVAALVIAASLALPRMVAGSDPGLAAPAAPANRAPVADAGPDIAAQPGEGVELFGAASFDPDGDALSFEWLQVAGPRVRLEPSARVANPAFEAPREAGRALVFELRVADGHGHASVDSVVVTIAAEPAPAGGPPMRGEVSLARAGR